MKEIDIYTDGACSGNPGPGGWGCILSFQGKTKEMSGFMADTTNNRMEIFAVISGLGALKEPCIVDVYSDSAYTVNAFRQGWLDNWQKNGWKKADKSPALNSDLWARLLDLSEAHTIHYNWIKGHAGHPENERCDQLAVAQSKAHGGRQGT